MPSIQVEQMLDDANHALAAERGTAGSLGALGGANDQTGQNVRTPLRRQPTGCRRVDTRRLNAAKRRSQDTFDRDNVRLLFGSCFTLMIAAAIGLGATWFTLTRGVAFGALTIGAWTAWPKSGSVDIDPYARASIARSGELPIGTGDGIAFYAHTDDAGREFRRPLHLHHRRHDAGGALLDNLAV